MTLGGMLPITGTNTTVTTTAARIAAAHGPDTRVTIYNRGSHPIFWGGADVTTDNGVLLAADSTKDFVLTTGDEIYAATTATQTAVSTIVSVHTQQT